MEPKYNNILCDCALHIIFSHQRKMNFRVRLQACARYKYPPLVYLFVQNWFYITYYSNAWFKFIK